MEKLRQRIDDIDSRMVRLFSDRMSVVAEIAEYKQLAGIPILDQNRETQKLTDVCNLATAEMKDYVKVLYRVLFEMSRIYQQSIIENVQVDITEICRKLISDLTED